jgi:hypothetical protein
MPDMNSPAENGEEGPSSCRWPRAAWWCAPARAALDGYSISVRDDLAAPCMSQSMVRGDLVGGDERFVRYCEAERLQ